MSELKDVRRDSTRVALHTLLAAPIAPPAASSNTARDVDPQTQPSDAASHNGRSNTRPDQFRQSLFLESDESYLVGTGNVQGRNLGRKLRPLYRGTNHVSVRMPITLRRLVLDVRDVSTRFCVEKYSSAFVLS